MKAVIVDAIYKDQNTSYNAMEAYKYSLEELGIKVDIVGPQEDVSDKYDLAFYSFFIWDNAGVRKVKAGKHIYFQIEQLPQMHRSVPFLAHRWYNFRTTCRDYKFDHIFDYSWSNTEYLKYYKYSVAHCPWGYSPAFDLTSKTKIGRYKHPVSFVGSLTSYRMQKLKFLMRRGIYVRILNTMGPLAIHRMRASNINLNIHAAKVTTFESGRIVAMALSNKCFIVTEPYSEEEAPIRDGQHLVTAVTGQMPKVIKHYLSNPEEAQEIAERGYNYIKNNYTMTKNLKYALEEIGVL